MYRLHLVTASVIIAAGVTGATCAQATVRVGGAAAIESNVSGSLPGQTPSRKIKGDDVYENEMIRTQTESRAQIIFVDRTDVILGPTSTMKIDRVVFNPNLSVRTLMVSAEAGALRWISGTSGSSAYQVKAPNVIIKVEGTTFDLFVDRQRTMVVLQEGRIEVCSVDAPQRCRTLSGRGDMVIATPSALEGPRPGPGASQFESRCLSATRQNCIIPATFEPTPAPDKRGSRTPPRERRVKKSGPDLASYEPTPKVYTPPPRRRFTYIPNRPSYGYVPSYQPAVIYRPRPMTPIMNRRPPNYPGFMGFRRRY
jgi:hypothetical protein